MENLGYILSAYLIGGGTLVGYFLILIRQRRTVERELALLGPGGERSSK